MDELHHLHPNGLFLRGEALDYGYLDRHLSEARRAGILHRVRHGAYVASSVWSDMDEEERFRLRGQAVALTHGLRVALSHSSGAAEHGLRLWGVPLDRVHVTRLDGGPSRHCGDVVYHSGAWTPDDVFTKDEHLVLGAPSCALGAASLVSLESGVVMLDSAVDLGLASVDSLAAAYESQMHAWPFTRKLQIGLRLTRPGAESVGESRARFLCWSRHLPEPVLQFHVYADGRLIGITDMAWPDHALLGEFDGKVKYGRLLKPGQEPGDAVFREKIREDNLREATGWSMVRMVWPDLSRPDETAERIRHQLRRSKTSMRTAN